MGSKNIAAFDDLVALNPTFPRGFRVLGHEGSGAQFVWMLWNCGGIFFANEECPPAVSPKKAMFEPQFRR